MQFNAVHGQLFRKHHLFASMNDEQMGKLMQSTQVVNLARGERLFNQGERAERFYLVISGRIKLVRMLHDGTEKIIELFDANQTFAEALIFVEEGKYPVGSQAVDPCALFSFSNADYKNLLKQDSALAFELLGNLSLRLHKRIREIEILSLKNSSTKDFLKSTNSRNQNSFQPPSAMRLDLEILPEPTALSRATFS